jgi:poly(3-hydroxybutyrate) depolymerase
VELFEPVAVAGELLPLLILLHANGEGPLAMATESGAGALAAREHLVVALPPARGGFWNAQVCCGDPIEATPDGAYVGGLIDRLAKDLPIDRGRVFVAGFSMGAVLTEQVACLYAASVTAVALDAGAPWSDECNASEPVSVLVMHGTADGTIPIKEGRRVVARWQALDACTGDPVPTKLSDNASSWQNDDCAEGTSVQFVQYGAGHRWFSDPDATEVLWRFFESRTKA